MDIKHAGLDRRAGCWAAVSLVQDPRHPVRPGKPSKSSAWAYRASIYPLLLFLGHRVYFPAQLVGGYTLSGYPDPGRAVVSGVVPSLLISKPGAFSVFQFAYSVPSHFLAWLVCE